MQSDQFPSFLPDETFNGTPCFHHTENIALTPFGFPIKTVATTPGVPFQVSDNMLGARARAAEYNAAKAATARQQANQEVEDQKIPKPPPLPLSAFARHAAASRNKGIKTFRPLVLTEEGTIDSTELDEQTESSLSPSTEPIVPTRPASLPPYTAARTLEVSRNTPLPHRYRDNHHAPFAPRAMMGSSSHVYGHHMLLPSTPQYVPYRPMYATIHTSPHMIHGPRMDWHTPAESYQDSYLNPEIGNTSVRSTVETHPDIAEQKESQVSIAADTEHFKGRSLRTSPAPFKDTPFRGSPDAYVFGPDDLSPTKFDVKKQAREKEFWEQLNALAETEIDAASMTKSDKSPERSCASQLRKAMSQEELGSAREMTPAQQAIMKWFLEGDFNRSSEPVIGRESSKLDQTRADATKAMTSAVPSRAEADWPYLGLSRIRPRTHVNHEARMNRLKPKTTVRRNVDEGNQRRILLERFNQNSEAGTATTAFLPPELSKPPSRAFPNRSYESDQITDLTFPLPAIHGPEWLELRMVTPSERNRIRLLFDMVNTGSISHKHQDMWSGKRGLPRPDFERHAELSKRRVLARCQHINQIASETQRKWQDWEVPVGLADRHSQDDQARQQACTAKAVGYIMGALSTQLEDKTGSHQRGSRPYCAAPDYAIEKSVALIENGRPVSLFEQDEDNNKATPARLARDPRFRPQLGEAIKREDARIPRMFVARRQ